MSNNFVISFLSTFSGSEPPRWLRAALEWSQSMSCRRHHLENTGILYQPDVPVRAARLGLDLRSDQAANLDEYAYCTANRALALAQHQAVQRRIGTLHLNQVACFL